MLIGVTFMGLPPCLQDAYNDFAVDHPKFSVVELLANGLLYPVDGSIDAWIDGIRSRDRAVLHFFKLIIQLFELFLHLFDFVCKRELQMRHLDQLLPPLLGQAHERLLL